MSSTEFSTKGSQRHERPHCICCCRLDSDSRHCWVYARALLAPQSNRTKEGLLVETVKSSR